jgi:hypothetical protein
MEEMVVFMVAVVAVVVHQKLRMGETEEMVA